MLVRCKLYLSKENILQLQNAKKSELARSNREKHMHLNLNTASPL